MDPETIDELLARYCTKLTFALDEIYDPAVYIDNVDQWDGEGELLGQELEGKVSEEESISSVENESSIIEHVEPKSKIQTRKLSPVLISQEMQEIFRQIREGKRKKEVSNVTNIASNKFPCLQPEVLYTSVSFMFNYCEFFFPLLLHNSKQCGIRR
jgi:hypothetical protein